MTLELIKNHPQDFEQTSDITGQYLKLTKPFPRNQKFDLTAPRSPTRIAKESSEADLEYQDGVQPYQLKRMVMPTHPVEKELTFEGV